MFCPAESDKHGNQASKEGPEESYVLSEENGICTLQTLEVPQTEDVSCEPNSKSCIEWIVFLSKNCRQLIEP